MRFELPDELAARVSGLAAQLGVTAFAVLFAAWAVVLARTGGQRDVVVGVPVLGRERAAAGRLVGMFVNTVALRVQVSAALSFTDLVAQVAAAMAAAHRHSGLPVQRVMAELARPRGAGATPLYQCAFNLLPDERLNYGFGTARDELALELAGRHARIEYRTNLFTAPTIEALAERYRRVLAAGTERPGRTVSELPLMGETERLAGLALGRGQPEWRVEPAATVPAQILDQAARTPDAVAVRCDGASIRYDALVDRAVAVAGRLWRHGVGPERLVAVALPRGEELVVALLGVLLAGGGYVPVDPRSPVDRLALLLADTRVTAVLTTAEHHPAVTAASAGSDRVVLDLADPPAESFVDMTWPGAQPGNVAYVLHTSGTTGRPKGVVIEHRTLAGYVSWFTRRHRLGPADRVLAATSPSFDAFGGAELWSILCRGGTAVVVSDHGGLDVDALLTVAADEAVTLINAVPTVLRMMADSPVLPRCTALRHVVAGGEQLSDGLAADVADHSGAAVHNLYGPTETTIAVSGHTWEPGRATAGVVPIGRPRPGALLYLLDESGGPVPVGAVGHLYVGGAPVGRGYHGAPGLTADSFRPDPSGPPGSRRYRTGDLARWTRSGELVFVGRADAQVKLRGVRIEPGEIEAVLGAQPGIRAAVVTVREDTPGDRRLVAYVRTADGIDLGSVRLALRARLPGHLVPTAIVALATFPLTASGKLNLTALPAPDGSGQRPRYQEPSTMAEQVVAEVWQEVLGVDRVGVGDDFFDLGGHSLLAARVAVRLGDALELDVAIHLLFEHPGLGALAAAVEDLLIAQIDALAGDAAAPEAGGVPR